jgi:hypothetical protein
MSYIYEKERPNIFTDEGQRSFLKVRDAAHRLLSVAGAFREQELMLASHVARDSWLHLAFIDRLVEIGEIRCVYYEPTIPRQHLVYVGCR